MATRKCLLGWRTPESGSRIRAGVDDELLAADHEAGGGGGGGGRTSPTGGGMAAGGKACKGGSASRGPHRTLERKVLEIMHTLALY
jgi:hypothetical protein